MHARGTIEGQQQQLRSFFCADPSFGRGAEGANKGLLCGWGWMFTTCRANGWHIFRSAHSLDWRFTTPPVIHQTPASFLFVLADVRQALGLYFSLSLFLFWRGGRISLAQAPRVLNFGGHLRRNSYRSLDQLSQQARHPPPSVLWFGF